MAIHGIGLKLIDAMIGYAREQQLKVIPLCPYVDEQFKKHPDLYQHVWNKSFNSQRDKCCQ
ncbi:N-acetyltransferase [Cesiribacter sp. SM1]|uniref:GNAT family N-acetyltransferase n=1 Tax=Cesiribacter sp. SM1 TaxID=2861196 RepID=UPI001CD6C87E